jgi:hypothetical protein
MARTLTVALVFLFPSAGTIAQEPNVQIGQAVPRDVREIYDKGLHYLAQTQTERGDWPGVHAGPGVTGMGLMVFLASGEDPNFGIYSNNVRRALRNIIGAQDGTTGYLGPSMYHHGFAMLALAEAYGVVDDRQLWPNGKGPRSVAAALELAVRAAITSQRRNRYGGWRYSPQATDADTSVSGAVLVGLLAARNAGIEVPDDAIDRAVSYYTKMTSASGNVAYTGSAGGLQESMARISIASLVYSLARRKDLPQFKATVQYLVDSMESTGPAKFNLELYQHYYKAQALYQGDVEAWKRWNTHIVRKFQSAQQPDGSFPCAYGPALGTSLTLLTVAVNYRLLPIYER